MYKMHNCKEEITIIDRLVGVATYFTFGAAGIIYLLIAYFSKTNLKDFVAYHIRQSIFLAIMLWAISFLLGISLAFIIKWPYIGGYVERLVIFFAGTPIHSDWNYSIIHLMILALNSYLAIGAILGKYSYIPFISDMMKPNYRGR